MGAFYQVKRQGEWFKRGLGAQRNDGAKNERHSKAQKTKTRPQKFGADFGKSNSRYTLVFSPASSHILIISVSFLYKVLLRKIFTNTYLGRNKS